MVPLNYKQTLASESLGHTGAADCPVFTEK